MIVSRTFKTFSSLLMLLVISSATAFAQSPADLSSPIYRDLDRWQVMGLAGPLPTIRPYPLQTIKALLTQVVENSQNSSLDLSQEARRAAAHLAAIGPEQPIIALDFSWQSRLEPGSSGYEGIAGLGGVITGWLADEVTVTGVINPYFIDRTNSFDRPVGQRRTQDWIEDQSDIELFGRAIDIRTRLLSTFAVGSPEISFQAGLSRTSIGPFFDDGIILSDQAPSTAQFLLSWNSQQVGYQLMLLPIEATNHRGGGLPGRTDFSTEKYLMYHAILWRPLGWLELGFFESVIYGGRFEWRYLVPLSSLFLTQGSAGFGDNTLMGITAVVRPAPGWQIPFQVYVDDFHFNDFVRLQLDTKYKLSGQLGVQWVPLGFPWLQRVRVDYTAVMPYMYTHFDENVAAYDPGNPNRNAALGSANLSNYTHSGTSLGPSLHPNSDRLRIDVDWQPVEGLHTNLLFRHIRHGNASAGISDGDGTIFDPGYIGPVPTFQGPFVDPTGQPYTRFLTQDLIESTSQIGLDVRWKAPLPAQFGRLDLNLSYLFQHINNSGLVSGATSNRHFLTLGLGYGF